MVLLPVDSVRHVDQHIDPFPREMKSVQTPGTASKRLDTEMSDVFNSEAFENDREKWKTQAQVLQCFLALKDIDTVKKPDEGGKKNEKMKIPKKKRKFLTFCKMCPKC